MLLLFNALIKADFGSVWWVRERLWKEALADQGYDSESKRDGHPGIALRGSAPIHSLQIVVPMLHGTSNWKRKAFTVRGLTPDHYGKTYFGHFSPAGLPLALFKSSRTIRQNWHKPALSDPEKQELRIFLDGTGIMS